MSFSSITSAQISSSTSCVAVVDDDPRIRALLEDELGEHGLTPYLCNSGLELLQLVKSLKVDVVMLDVTMPEMSGLECLEPLREAGFSGEILMLTAVNDNGMRNAALAAGAKEYVLKTDLFEELPRLLQRYLQIEVSDC
jgi:CheY-like chemotaxis protein